MDEAEKKRIELKKKEDGEFWYMADTQKHSSDGNISNKNSKP